MSEEASAICYRRKQARLGDLPLTVDIATLGLTHQQRGRLAVQRIRQVGVPEELGEEDLEDVDHIKHRRPRLVDDIQAYGARPMIPTLSSPELPTQDIYSLYSVRVWYIRIRICPAYSSSMLGWKMRLTKPMLGDL